MYVHHHNNMLAITLNKEMTAGAFYTFNLKAIIITTIVLMFAETLLVCIYLFSAHSTCKFFGFIISASRTGKRSTSRLYCVKQ